ncbi:MAG: hypothetical protein GC186_01775 [Rhodobacteraceae bacterium]|nr:hypothetical protein [Paracoccaceae bacterium]
MDRTRKLAMIGATFLLAAATGQYMQSGRLQRSTVPVVPAIVAKAQPPAQKPAAQPLQVSAPADAGPAPILPTPALAAPLPSDTVSIVLPQGEDVPKAQPLSCDPVLTLSVKPGAMLSLALTAPCNANARVVILADGLSFTGLTSAAGLLAVDLPAMADPARVTVRFAGGATVTAGADVPGLKAFERVGVQWMGPDAFALHALEFGADFGTGGDVSAAAPRAPADVAMTSGGFLTGLGDASVDLPMQAEVYTVPKALATAGKVRIVLDAPVRAATCGREMLGQMLTVRPGGKPATSDLSLAMPDCDPASFGQFVELPGIVPDLAVASR